MESEMKKTRVQLYQEMKDDPRYIGLGALSRMRKEELLALKESAPIRSAVVPVSVGEGRKKKEQQKKRGKESKKPSKRVLIPSSVASSE